MYVSLPFYARIELPDLCSQGYVLKKIHDYLWTHNHHKAPKFAYTRPLGQVNLDMSLIWLYKVRPGR